MVTKKHLMILGGALAAFYVLKQPNGAAAAVNNAASGIGSAADSLAQFVNALGS